MKRRALSVLLLLLVATLYACGEPIPTPTPVPPLPSVTHTPFETPTLVVEAPPATLLPVPPFVVSVSPEDGQELLPDGEIVLRFSTTMDKASVESSISFTPSLVGGFFWEDDQTLVFTPEKPLTTGSQIVLEVDAVAKDAVGFEMTTVFRQTFQIMDNLVMTDAFPVPGSSDVSADTGIRVVFNRPVVPLSTLGGADAPSPIVIEPSVEGHGEWVNTSIFVFEPDSALVGGQEYAIRMAQVTSLDGASLSGTKSWRFTVARPHIVAVEPVDGDSLVDPDTVISIEFSQAMDKSAAEQAVTLVPAAGGSRIEGKVSWQDNTLEFSPHQPLGRGTAYLLTVVSGIPARDGGSTTKDTESVWFAISPWAQILSFEPQGDLASINDGLEITFSCPISTETVIDNLEIEPAVDMHVYWRDEQRIAYVSGLLEPSTDYLVRLSDDIQDIYGEPLLEAAEFSFTTAPLEPNLWLGIPHRAGLYNAYGATSVPVRAVNVGSLEFSLYRLSEADLLQLTGSGSYQAWNRYAAHENQLVRSWRRGVDAGLNSTVVVTEALDETGTLAAGLYYLEVSSPDAPARLLKHVVVVSDSNVLVKRSESEALIWVTDLRTGEPVVGTDVTLYDDGGQELGQGRTDNEGLLELSFEPQDPWDTLVARIKRGNDLSVHLTSWNEGILAWEYDLSTAMYVTDYLGYVYTDRDIYRPGQRVYYKAVIRADQDADYALPEPGTEATVIISDNQGRQLVRQDVLLSAWGTLDGELLLSPEASLGHYAVTIEIGDTYAHDEFLVAEYEKPEFEVAIQSGRSEYLDGEMIRAVVQSDYLFGGAVGDSRVDWNVLVTPFFFTPPDAYRFWSFADYDAYWNMGAELVAEGTTETDDSGMAVIQLEADTGEFPYSVTYSLEATVTDISNRQVSERTALVVHQSDLYIGVHPLEYVGQAGQTRQIELVSLDASGEAIVGQSLRVELNEQRWLTVREQGPDGVYYWTSREDLTPVMTRTVTTGRDGEAVALFTLDEPGSYKVTVSGADASGRLSESAAYLWIAGEGYVNWGRDNDDRIELVADRDEYQVGQVARILVPSPFDEPVTGLLTIERGSIVEHQLVEIAASSDTLVVPIEQSYAPNVFVSLALVRGMDSPEELPNFKLGYVTLNVSADQKELDIRVRPLQGVELSPGQEVSFEVEVRDHEGQPIEAELNLAMVDKAVESLWDSRDKGIFEAFYESRGLGIITSSSWTASADRYVQDAGGGAKGGGGGAGDEGYVRQSFPDTAYWKAALETDEKGHAQFTVFLPDNLTTWRLAVNGVSGAELFGAAEVDLVTSLDLMIRPSTPRFLVSGDEPVISAIVYNNTDRDLDLDVSLAVSGLEIESAEQQIHLLAREQMRVEWPGVVGSTEEIELLFTAEGGGLHDAAMVKLPVVHSSTPEYVGTSGTVDARVVEHFLLEDEIDTSRGELLITLEPSLAAVLRDSLDYLESYPYHCTEQTVSRFLPNVVTLDALETLGLERSDLDVALSQQVTLGLQRLYDSQNVDGGWGWWSSQESSPRVTAYVVLGLDAADEAGFTVEEWVQNAAVAYLDDWLAGNTPRTAVDKDAWAEVLYVLARVDQGQLGRCIWLYEEHDGMSLYARALLAMSLGQLDNDTVRSTTLLNELADAAILDASGVHWEEKSKSPWAMNTNTRTSAVVLQAFEELAPSSGLLSGAVRWLVSARESGHWQTTQENVWSIIALTKHMVNTGELEAEYNMTASLNGRERISGKVGADNVDRTAAVSIPIDELEMDDVNQLVIQKDGDGELYYSAFVRYYVSATDVEALDRGIYVSRSYGNQRHPDEPVTSAAVNDIIMVHLTIVAPHDLHYLVVEDFFPAGCQALDPNLDIVSQLIAHPQFERVSSDTDKWKWYNPHWPNRVELRDDRVVLFADRLAAGTYEFVYAMQCSTAGEYQALPTTAYQMYAPDVFGRGSGAQIVIEN